MLDEEVQRLLWLGHQELLKQILEQLVDVVVLEVALNLLLEFKFLAFVHFYFYLNFFQFKLMCFCDFVYA